MSTTFDVLKHLVLFIESSANLSIEQHVELYKSFMKEFGKDTLNQLIFKGLFQLKQERIQQQYIQFFENGKMSRKK